jgi:hypothetical protein
MTEWHIQSRGHLCAACSRPFVDKEQYHTLLFDNRAEFQRLDVCGACWQAQYSEGARERKGFVSYWQGVYEAPLPPTEPILKETAESLLRKLVEQNDPKQIPATYILAAMLERKRLLKIKEQLVRDGRRLFIYEHCRSGDAFTIVDPNLQLDQLEQVQHDVALLLQQGLNPPATAAPAGSEPPGIAAAPGAESTVAEPIGPAAAASVNEKVP